MVFGRIKANPCALKVHVCSRLSQHLLHPQFLLFCVLCSHALHTLFHISQQGNDRMLQVYGREPLTNHVLPPCYTHGDRKVNLTLRVTVTNPILSVFMYGFWVLIKIDLSDDFRAVYVWDQKVEVLNHSLSNCEFFLIIFRNYEGVLVLKISVVVDYVTERSFGLYVEIL